MFKLVQQAAAKPKRVVVLGAGGFVGGSVARKLSADGVEILPVTRREIDLLAPGAAQKLVECLKPTDTLLFVSAIAPTRTAGQLADNVAMARAVCDGLERSKVAHLCYVSSDAVYADSQSPITESSSLGISGGLHGAMHIAREAMVTATRIPMCIIRPTIVYGARDPHNSYGPNRFRRQAAAGEDIVLFGGGEEMRDHIAIEDLAVLISLCLSHQAQGVVNAATGRSTSFRQVAEMVAAGAGRPVRIIETPRQNPIIHRHFDTAELMAAFPSFRFTALSDGLRRAAQAASDVPRRS